MCYTQAYITANAAIGMLTANLLSQSET